MSPTHARATAAGDLSEFLTSQDAEVSDWTQQVICLVLALLPAGMVQRSISLV